MQRPRGVVAIAVVAILGSLCTLALGGLIFLYLAAVRASPGPIFLPPGASFSVKDMESVLLTDAVVLCVLGVVGAVSAVALFRMKDWARVAFLVFAGILMGTGLVGGGSIAVTLLAGAAATGVSPELNAIVGAGMLFVALCFSALAVWWLVYLTRPHIRVAYLGEARATEPRRGPISVTIIGWMLLVGGCFTPLSTLISSAPAMLFGFVLHDWGARAFGFTLGSMSIVAGVGLLRWRPRALPFAMGVYALSLLNTLSLALIPGALPRFREAIRNAGQANPTAEAMTADAFGMMIALGFLGAVIPMYFLAVNRKAFLETCQRGTGENKPTPTQRDSDS